MNFPQLLPSAKSWFRLVGFSVISAGIITFTLLHFSTPMYAVVAVIMTDYNSFSFSFDHPEKWDLITLTGTSGEKLELAKSNPEGYERVIEGTLHELGLNLTPTQLDQVFTTRLIPDTHLLQIDVQYKDPVLAVDIASELARQFICAYSSVPLDQHQADSIRNIEKQLTQLELELANIGLQLKQATEDQRRNLTIARIQVVEQMDNINANYPQFAFGLTRSERWCNGLFSGSLIPFVHISKIPEVPISPPAHVITVPTIGIAFTICCLILLGSRIVRFRKSA